MPRSLSYFLDISNWVGNLDKCLRGTLISFIMLMELPIKTIYNPITKSL